MHFPQFLMHSKTEQGTKYLSPWTPPWPHWRKRFPGFPLNSLPFPFAFLSRFCFVVTRTASHWRWLPWQRTGSCAFEALQGKQGTEPVFHFVAGSSDTLISQEQLCLRRKYQTLVLFLDSLTRAPWQTFWRSIDHLKETHGSPFFAFPEPVCECWAICVLRQGKWWSCGWQKGSGIKSCPCETQVWALPGSERGIQVFLPLPTAAGHLSLNRVVYKYPTNRRVFILCSWQAAVFAIGDISRQGLQVTLNVLGWGEWALFQT